MPLSPVGTTEQTIQRDGPGACPSAGGQPSGFETRDAPVPPPAADDATQGPNRVSHDLPDLTATPMPAGSLLPALPGFVFTGEIARGGMGVIYSARERSLNREVAVKTLLTGVKLLPAAVRRFVTEARITARLSHPNIPPVYGLGALPDGRPYLSMKLIRGRTLAAILAARAQQRAAGDDDGERTALHGPGLLQVFEQICQAVGFAHARGVIHRDLKPANVMLGAFGEVQVVDWGLARELAHAAAAPDAAEVEFAAVASVADTGAVARDDTERSRLGEALGTPAFMPPEQALGEWDRIDARADVFALGGILCVILTGHPPYSGQTVAELIRRASGADLGEAFARLDACGAERELVALAKRCLSPDPADRLPDACTVVAALHAYQFRCEEAHQAAAAAAALRAARAEARTAVAAARAAAEERLRLAVHQADQRRIRATQRHWTATAVIVLTILLTTYLYQHLRDRPAPGHPAPAPNPPCAGAER